MEARMARASRSFGTLNPRIRARGTRVQPRSRESAAADQASHIMMPMSGSTDPAEPTRSSDLDCRRIAELLGDYLEGTLPKSTKELLEWHIEGCPPCVAFINTYRGTVNATRALRD